LLSTAAVSSPIMDSPTVAHPRARRALRSALVDHDSDQHLSLPPGNGRPNSGLSRCVSTLIEGRPPLFANLASGTSTPIPSDAPPSVKATSSARKQKRAQHKQHRMFPTIDYSARVSHLDPKSDHHDFTGFFVLFWVGLAIMVITAMLRNFKETGLPLIFSQWSLFTENLGELALSEFLMAASTYLCLALQNLFLRSQIFRWYGFGMALQSVFQACWLLYWIGWPFIRTWTWTAQVFFTLHILALFMKMHSYA
jgi:sterol O-acyltransferase